MCVSSPSVISRQIFSFSQAASSRSRRKEIYTSSLHGAVLLIVCCTPTALSSVKSSLLHYSRDAKLFDDNRGKQARADKFEESAYDAVCQRICWIALQMAQLEMDWLKGELQQLEQKIEDQEAKIEAAIKDKEGASLQSRRRGIALSTR